ncbi:unnamed protein product [Amoebophrya sp. A120]|nr:unnamed protein product [Amoebophrya sp. A120]|eukprot:GSA120T00014993001.1
MKRWCELDRSPFIDVLRKILTIRAMLFVFKRSNKNTMQNQKREATLGQYCQVSGRYDGTTNTREFRRRRRIFCNFDENINICPGKLTPSYEYSCVVWVSFCSLHAKMHVLLLSCGTIVIRTLIPTACEQRHTTLCRPSLVRHVLAGENSFYGCNKKIKSVRKLLLRAY